MALWLGLTEEATLKELPRFYHMVLEKVRTTIEKEMKNLFLINFLFIETYTKSIDEKI